MAKFIKLSELNKFGTFSAEFFCKIDDDIRKQYQDISDEKAERLINAYYGADKK